MSTTQTGRNEWAVQITSETLGRASKRLDEYHESRREWWDEQLVQAEEAVNAAGITVHRHQVTGGDRFEAQLDPSLAKRLHECEAKQGTHTASRDTYRQWAAFFASATGQSWWVSYSDHVYFDLGKQLNSETATEDALAA